MRNWKNWLFPILTCLTVAALALLPPRLSVLRDGRLAGGTVHAEPLAEDSNFPFKPPELPGRVWLLSQWNAMPEKLTIMSQNLEDGTPEWENALVLADEALRDLAGLGVFVKGAGEFNRGLSAERLYLRDQTDLSSASFLSCSGYSKEDGHYFSLILDGETGGMMLLDYQNKSGDMGELSPLELGGKFLDRLGLSWELEEEGGVFAYFRLTEERRSRFFCFAAPGELMFQFEADWSALDGSSAPDEALGIDSSVDAAAASRR